MHQFHVVENGWSDCGYHYVISKANGIEICRPIYRVGAHAKKHNQYSIGICLTGRYVFSEKQFDNLEDLLWNLLAIFNLKHTDIYGHYEVDETKTCPNFDLDIIRERFITE